MLQEKRRKEFFDRSEMRRSGYIEYVRVTLVIYRQKRQKLFLEISNQPTQPIMQSNFTESMDIEDKSEIRKKEANKDFARRKRFSKSLCIPEWMIEGTELLNRLLAKIQLW